MRCRKRPAKLGVRNAALSAAVAICAASTANAGILLTDNFSTGFNTTATWQQLPVTIISGGSAGYLGLPQSAVASNISGQPVETFTSSLAGNNEYTGFQSQAAFNGLSSATLTVDFYTNSGIDTLLAAGLAGDSSTELIGVFGGDFGADRTVYVGPGTSNRATASNGPNDWQLGNFYQFTIVASPDSSVLSFQTSSGSVLYSDTYPVGINELGPNLRVDIEQGVGSPNTSESVSASVDLAQLSGTSVPEPTASLLAVGAVASLALRRSSVRRASAR